MFLVDEFRTHFSGWIKDQPYATQGVTCSLKACLCWSLVHDIPMIRGYNTPWGEATPFVEAGSPRHSNVFLRFKVCVTIRKNFDQKLAQTATSSTIGLLHGPIPKPTLVGGLEHLDYFSIYWECHNPIWLSYFSEGFKPPTSDGATWCHHGHRRSCWADGKTPASPWAVAIHETSATTHSGIRVCTW